MSGNSAEQPVGLWPVPDGVAGPAEGDGGGLEGQQGEEAARQICLRLLTTRPRTRAQLAGALRRRGVSAEAAKVILDRLTDVGLIDDAAFARAWVETRHNGRGLARRALANELRHRGVDAGEVQAAVSTLGADDEMLTARRLVEKRLPATRGKPPATRARQLAGILARKGYPAGVAYRVVREALAQDGVAASSVPDLPDTDD